jgi:hypothetical protein
MVCLAAIPFVLGGDPKAAFGVLLLVALDLRCHSILRARKRAIAKYGSLARAKTEVASEIAELESAEAQAQVEADVAHGIGHRPQVRVRR